MQQAYRVLRVVAEAQTIRMVLPTSPAEQMLSELCTACTTLNTESSMGIKAVVLDFKPGTDAGIAPGAHSIEQASKALRAVEQPVLAVVRGGRLSAVASLLVRTADLALVAHDATLHIIHAQTGNETLTGNQAVRLGYASWSASAGDLGKETERILDMLRKNSSITLRHAKASVRLSSATLRQQANATKRLEALKQVNELYLTRVMQTADASEGLHAFIEKRKPAWKNR